MIIEFQANISENTERFALMPATGQIRVGWTIPCFDQIVKTNGSSYARGYYFFRLRYTNAEGQEFEERGKVLVVR